MGIELATAYVSIVPETSRVAGLLGRAFGTAGTNAGQTAGQAAGGGIADSLRSMGGKGGPIAAAVGVIGVAAGAALVSSITAGMEREKVADLTQARLGVDDATMKKIGNAAASAYTNAFGASVEENMDTARRAIQSGLLNPDDTAQDTQAVIEQISAIADLIGEDIPKVSRAAGQAIKTGLAEDAAGAFDLLAAAERNGLNVSEDVLDTVIEYGTQFRKLGLDGADAFGLMNQAVEGGARDVDTAADAIKEFSLRVLDGSTSTTEAFQDLGFDADDLASKFAEGGAVARAATGDLLDKIREIEDPVKRNEIALALFATKFEDLGGAFDNFDLSNAAASLGQVEGAAKSAADTIGGNAATSIESAKRSIEVSMQGVQNSLAQAFGPTLEKVAEWVRTHQPEITGFFIKVGEGAFALGDIMLLWASTTATNLSAVLRSFGSTLEGILDPIGTAAVAIGKLTGKQGLVDFGNTLKSVQDKMNSAADGLDGFADVIDSKARPALANMRASFTESAEQAKDFQLVTRALGDEVELLPSDKDILITSNTPEQRAALEALGLRLEELDDQPGVFKVVSNTAEGQKVIDNFVATNTGTVVPTKVTADTTPAQAALDAFVTQNTNTRAVNVGVNQQLLGIPSNANGGIWSFADGKLPGRAMIQPGRGRGLVQWAEGETGGEAFIPLALSKRDRSLAIWEEVGRRLGVEGFAEGGIKEALDYARGAAGSPYQYGGVASPSWDCSGIQSDIWAKLTGRPTGARYFTTESDFEALGFLPGLGGPDDYSIGISRGGGGPNSHMAGTLGGVNIESSGADGVEVGVGAQGAADLPLQFHYPLSGDPGGSTGGSASNTGTLGSGGTNTTGATEVFIVNWPNGIGTGGASTTATDMPDTDPANTMPTADEPATAEQSTHPLQGTPLTGELFNGDAPWYLASSPEQALANLSTQAATQWESTASDLQSFVGDNWREMVETGAGVLGMGAMGGGMTVNNYGMDPASAASAVERVVRRTNLATMRNGGFGR